MRIVTIIAIILLICFLFGCSKGTPSIIPQTESIDENISVSTDHVSVPDETITSELDDSSEPDFGTVS